MGMPLSVLAPGVAAGGIPATAKVTANARVATASGPVGVIADVMQFPGPVVVGNWMVGCTRVSIMGLPAIDQASTGTSFTAVGAPFGPMTVIQGDPRASGM
jgi:spore maturation protein SpmB